MYKILLCLVLSFSSLSYAAKPAGTKRPKLIVTVVFDQFRADYLLRFESRFLPAQQGGILGGFRTLMQSGAYYPYADYELLQSMTGPGHATILTGSYPYQNGIGINTWFDQKSGERVYCVEDSKYEWVGTKKPDSHSGSSPRNFTGSTVGDELKNAGYPSRVVSIAVKDRAAILMGGYRPDVAMWFNMPTRSWVSSDYYFSDKKLPDWIAKLNKDFTETLPSVAKLEITGEGTGFSLKDPMIITSPRYKGSSYALNEAFVGGLATVTAAEHAIDHYKLGSGKATDLLAISFSTHDYLGHEYGPNSREMEEFTVTEDRLLSRLLNSIAKKIPGGLKDVVVVLTADHGIPPNTTWLSTQKVPAGLIDEKDLGAVINKALTAKFGQPKGGKWVAFNYDSHVWISREALAAQKATLEEVENEARLAMQSYPGIAWVMTGGDFKTRKLPPGMIERQFLRSYVSGRSGDVIFLPKPFFSLDGDTVNHITGYAYDRTVPLIIMGEGFKPGRYAQKANVVDIAPTLTFIAGTVPPSLSEGRVLSEIFAK